MSTSWTAAIQSGSASANKAENFALQCNVTSDSTQNSLISILSNSRTHDVTFVVFARRKILAFCGNFHSCAEIMHGNSFFICNNGEISSPEHSNLSGQSRARRASCMTNGNEWRVKFFPLDLSKAFSLSNSTLEHEHRVDDFICIRYRDSRSVCRHSAFCRNFPS